MIHQCLAANVESLVFTSTSHVAIPRRDPLFLAAEHSVQTPPKDGFLFGNYGRTKFEAENLVKEANGKRLANGIINTQPLVSFNWKKSHFNRFKLS